MKYTRTKRGGSKPKHKLEGQRFGSLLVLRLARSGLGRRWICRCDCGAKKTLPTNHLVRKTHPVRSCGCAKVRHGLYGTPEYDAWRGKYQTLLIEKFDLRDVAERPKPEDKQDHVQPKARARMHAAPSELRSALIAAFHGNHVEQSADHNTLACEKCGTITDDTPADSIVITCPSCNSEHDQDRNNCQNQLARYRGRYKGPAPLAAE